MDRGILKVTVSAPGRICLFGEHMDWCGHEVLPSALDMRLFLEAEAVGGQFVEAFSYSPFNIYDEFNLKKIHIDWSSDLKYVGGVLKAFQKRELPYTIAGMNLRFLRTSKNGLRLPANKGLSSSAAMCVTVSAAVDLIHRFQNSTSYLVFTIMQNYLSKPETLTFYADMAYSGERKELGINCGQMDPYASAYGGILHIDCTTEPARVHRLEPKIELPLVVGDTRQPKDTPRILSWLGERFRTKEVRFIHGMENIVRIVQEAKEELEKPTPNRHKIGELMNENQCYLKEYLEVSGDCPISPSNLDDLIEAALHAGALGAKLSGSGGGGCMIALCDPGDEIKVMRAISQAGGEAYVTKVADKGLRIEAIDP